MITLKHTHAEGTVAVGTSKGDGSSTALKAKSWRWSATLGMWVVPRSRDTRPDLPKLHETQEALEAAGFEVVIEIDDTRRRPEEIEADRAERRQARADSQRSKATKLHATADSEWAAGRAATASIPLGQPILVDHHSAPRHRAALAKADRHDRRAIDAYNAGKEAQRRADVAQAAVDTRYLPRAVAGRIDRLESESRAIERRLNGYSRTFAGGYVETYPPVEGALRDQLLDDLAVARGNLDYWRGVRDQQQVDGAAPYSRETIARGDQIRAGGDRWLEVVRGNTKSVTVQPIVGGSWTDRLPYHKITGHRPATAQAD